MLKNWFVRVGAPGLVLVAGAITGGAKWHDVPDKNSAWFPWAALLATSLVLLIVLIVLDRLAGMTKNTERKAYGWVNAIIGSDGRVSTSKTQMFLWTVTIASALVYLTMIAVFKRGPDGDVMAHTNWDDYLILLGGPFAAGVLAKYTVATQLASGNLQKTVLKTASSDAGGTATGEDSGQAPAATNVLTNDAGELDLVDTQYVVFNLVTLIFVVATFVSRIIDQSQIGDELRYSLPAIPPVLLGLTGASAAAYVANKAAVKGAPAITTLTPVQPQAGQVVAVLGVSLVPNGTSEADARRDTRVVIRQEGAAADVPGRVVAAKDRATSTQVDFVMPPEFTGMTVEVQVITAANVATPPFKISVT